MSQILAFVVPSCLFLYLFINSRNKISGLIALFLFPTFGKNAYIYPTIFNNRIKPIDIQFVLILILSIIICKFRHKPGIKGLNIEKILNLLLVVLIFFHLSQGIIDGFPYSIVPQTYRIFIYYVLGLYLWYSILRRISKEEFEELLRILTIPTIYLSILYILSALGTDIYGYKPYLSAYVGNDLIIRDFNTSPFFLFISLSYLLLYSKLCWKDFCAIGILTLATFFLYTRVFTFQWLLIVIFGFYWRFANKRQRTRQFIVLFCFIFFLLLLIFLVNNFFPSKTIYYFSRINEVVSSGFQTSTFQVRKNLNILAIESLQNQNRLLFGNGIRYYFDLDLGKMNAPLMDSPIAYFLYFFGILGFVLLMLQMIIASVKSFISSFSTNILLSRIGMFLFLSIIIYSLSVISDTYIYDGVVGALWISAIVINNQRDWFRKKEETCALENK